MVRVSGSNRKPLLEIIRSEFWKLHESYEWLQYQELIPCNCEKCANSPQPEFYPHTLLMQYLSDRRYNIECRNSYQSVDVRRLITDITDSSAQIQIEEDPRAIRDREYRERKARLGYSPSGIAARDIKDSIIILGNNNTANTELAQSAQDIKTLLTELSEEYNATSPKGQNKIQADVIERVQQTPELKTRFLKALKASGEQALIEAVNHPAARVTIKGLKAFFEKS